MTFKWVNFIYPDLLFYWWSIYDDVDLKVDSHVLRVFAFMDVMRLGRMVRA